MNAASTSLIHELRPKIIEKRARLEAAAQSLPAEYVNGLLAEIDAALSRIDEGSYGICEACHDTIEADRLARDRQVAGQFALDEVVEKRFRFRTPP